MDKYEDFPRPPGYLTVKEVAEILNVSDKMVYLYIMQKRLPAMKIGKTYLIAQDDLDQFKKKSVGRPRKKSPDWKISTKDNELLVTTINVKMRAEMQTKLRKKLREIQRGKTHQFVGTVERYIVNFASAPDRVTIMLFWKLGFMPSETTRQEAWLAFQQELADVLDWDTALYDEGTAWMNT